MGKARVAALLVVWLLMAGLAAASLEEFSGVVQAMPAKGYYGEWLISGKRVKVSPGRSWISGGASPGWVPGSSWRGAGPRTPFWPGS